MAGYRVLLEKEVIEAWRTWRIGLVCALFLVLGIVSPLVTRYLAGIVGAINPTEGDVGIGELGPADVLDLLVRNLVLFGAITGVLLAMGAVAGERERGTAALVLTRPVTRAAFLWAKVVALAMILGLGIGLAVLAAWLYTGLLLGLPPLLPWVQMALVTWLSALVYALLTLLGSTLTPTPLGAAAFGFGALVLFSLASAATALATWLPTGLADVGLTLALEDLSPDLEPGRTIAVAIGIGVAAIGLAWLRLRRLEL